MFILCTITNLKWHYSFTGNDGLCGIPGLPECGPHLSVGAKIGIAFGSLFALLFVLVFITCWWKRRQNILRAQKLAAGEAKLKLTIIILYKRGRGQRGGGNGGAWTSLNLRKLLHIKNKLLLFDIPMIGASFISLILHHSQELCYILKIKLAFLI